MFCFKKAFKGIFVFSFFFFFVSSYLKPNRSVGDSSGEEVQSENHRSSRVSGLDYVPGELIVRLRESSGGKRNFLDSSSQNALGKLPSSGRIVLKKNVDGLLVYKVSSGGSLSSSANVASKLGGEGNLEEVISSLEEDPRVEYAELNYYLYRPPDGSPNHLSDEEIERLTLQAQSTESTSSVPSSGVENGARESLQDGSSSVRSAEEDSIGLSQKSVISENPVIVAVIDSGLDTDHYYFEDTKSIWENSGEAEEMASNNIDDDGNGYVDDFQGWNFLNNSNDIEDDDSHGSHISGIIIRTFYELTSFFQSLTMRKVSDPKIKIMSLKFSDYENQGTVLSAAQAIRYAIRNGAKIINASWGSPFYSITLHRAIAEAYERGVLFVNSGGNETQNNDNLSYYPGNINIPNMVSVAASNVSLEGGGQSNPSENLVLKRSQLAHFSNFGRRTVHIAAPGVEIVSAVPDGLAVASGTSQSAAVVSGLASRILNQYPHFLAYQLREVLFSESTQADSLSELLITGAYVNLRGVYSLSSNLVFNTGNQPKYIFQTPEGEKGSSSFSSHEPEKDREKKEELENTFKEIAGCGIINRFYPKSGDGKGGSGKSQKNLFSILFILVLMSFPFLVNFAMYRIVRLKRRKARKYPRFKIKSKVLIQVGSKVFSGNVQTISLGGAQMKTEAILEQGGIVKMNIHSVDGKNSIEVEGHIVWKEARKQYGVQFLNFKNNALSHISNWTKSLKKV